MNGTTLAVPATASRSRAADYWMLAKPGITVMVAITAALGYYIAARGGLDWRVLAHLVGGTLLSSAGAAALNMVLERKLDARMDRTKNRPLPAGRLGAAEATAFGLALSAGGVAWLGLGTNWLVAGLSAATIGSYLFLYTPLKRRTHLSTLVGAVPGALPPVIGWAAASGRLEPGAFILFAIVFLWQIPHFLAIAWLYREDYERGGFPMLPVIDREGRITGRQAVLHSVALVVVSLAPVAAGLGDALYLVGALVLGIALTLAALQLSRARDVAAARTLFVASVLYLPALTSLLLLAKL